MKIDSIITKRVQRHGFTCTADRDLKARQEQHSYKWFMIGAGYYACVHDQKAHVIEETQKTLACSCMDMTHRCRVGEGCKHIIAFGNLLQLPVQPVPDEIAVLLHDQGWTGERLLLPPKEPEPKPTHTAPYTEPAKKDPKSKYDGLTPAQMCEAMDIKELTRNAKRGGVAAKAELKKRQEAQG